MTITKAQVEALAAGSAGLAFRGRGAVEVVLMGQAYAPLELLQAVAAMALVPVPVPTPAQAPTPAPSAKKGRG